MDVLDKGFVELVNYMGDDNTVISAARVSHLGESKGKQADEKLIKYLMSHGHTSPFEQVEFQFRAKAPIFVARQWMRHRTWSYNEVSRRYTSEEIDFYIPQELRYQSVSDKQASENVLSDPWAKTLIKSIEKNSEGSYRLYEILLENGVCREQARMVLPVNMYTSFYAKTNLHNLFHFLELRNSPHAQYEIRVYAEAIEKIIEPIVPVSYHIWKELKK